MRTRSLVFIAAILSLAACDSGSGSGGSSTPSGGSDATSSSETTGGTSGGSCESWQGLTSDFRGDDPLGATCDVSSLNSTCASGYCIKAGDRSFCTVGCSDGTSCGDMRCQAFINERGKQGHVCVPKDITLCDKGVEGEDPFDDGCDDAFDGVCPPNCPMDPDC